MTKISIFQSNKYNSVITLQFVQNRDERKQFHKNFFFHKNFRYVRQAIVTVLVPPKFTKRPHLDKPVTEGTELELPCSASGFPIPTVEWTYNGQPITTTTATISINAGTLKIGPVTTQVRPLVLNLFLLHEKHIEAP